MRSALLATGLCMLTACTVPKDAGFPDVQDAVKERGGAELSWHRDDRAEKAIRAEIDRIVAKPLTLGGAVKTALMNNRELQATYEDLGVAQADLVQAGMIENPNLGGMLRFPTEGPLSPNVEGALGVSFLSIFTVAARKRIAAAAFEEAKRVVGSQALMLIADVREAFYTFQAAQQLAAINLTLAQASQASFDFAKELHRAGNLNDLEYSQEQALYETARLTLVDTQRELFTSREMLTKLMGLWGKHAQRWQVAEELAGVPRSDPPLAKLETLAVKQRLDLAAAKKRTVMMAEALGMSETWGWLQGFELGGSVERDVDGGIVVGPEASLALPLFDQGQARVAHAQASLRRSYHQATSLAVTIRSDVRRLRNDMVTHRRKADHYANVVIPLRERIVELSMEQYNFMLIGLFQLLESKQREFETYREYVHEVRDYWIARAKLGYAVGGKLPGAEAGRAAKPPAPPPTSSKPDQEHRDHE